MPGDHDRRSSLEVLIDHANRLWMSECENAARIARRSQILTAGGLGVLGLGFFSFAWRYSTTSAPMLHPAVTIALHIVLIAAVGAIGRSLSVIYLRPKGYASRGTALEVMEVTQSDLGKPTRQMVFGKTYRAYLELKRRNNEMWFRLKRGQSWYVIGVSFIFIAILTYLVASIPAKISDGVTSNGDDNAATSTENGSPNGEGIVAPSGSGNGTDKREHQ